MRPVDEGVILRQPEPGPRSDANGSKNETPRRTHTSRRRSEYTSTAAGSRSEAFETGVGGSADTSVSRVQAWKRSTMRSAWLEKSSVADLASADGERMSLVPTIRIARKAGKGARSRSRARR